MNRGQQFGIATALMVGCSLSPLFAQTITANVTSCDTGGDGQPAITLVAPTSNRVLHVAIPLPQDAKVARNKIWQLAEVDHPQATVPVQFVALAADDGSAKLEGGELLAVIPPRDGARDQRRFRLEAVVSAKRVGGPFEYRETSETSLGLWEGERPVLVYNHGEVVNKDVPENDHRRKRACYIHPVWGLNGEVLTADFPKDHYHHHGIFWTWPHVGVGGQEYDLWMSRKIHQKFVRWIHRESGPLASVMAVENGWFVGDKQVMIERVWLRVFKASDDARAIDISLTWIPTDQPVTLRGAEGKSYGGLTIRFAPRSRQSTMITVPNGRTDRDLPDTPLAWADLTAEFGSAEAASGAALLVHPKHPDFPPTWLTRHYGPLCVGWPGIEPQTFLPGKPLRLDYRVWIHKTQVTSARLHEAYGDYSASTEAVWK
ncbi:MAG: PmoA family protein [Pirellulaceae bacterium]|nr:PmoA family protein [Pirellulaceae bacterium]MDP6721391.1 PmoA family protein [Pirellulaceae bacterium]